MSVTIDLKALYGTDKLTKGQRFSTGHDATKFILAYGLKNNKKLHVPQTGGRCNQYRCKSACCEWSATVTKQKKPPFDYKVSSLNDNHSDTCMAPAQPTQRQITSLPEFQVAVLSDAKVSGNALMTVMATREGSVSTTATWTGYVHQDIKHMELASTHRASSFGVHFSNAFQICLLPKGELLLWHPIRSLEQLLRNITPRLCTTERGYYFGGFDSKATTV